jgi:hypothetical protein
MTLTRGKKRDHTFLPLHCQHLQKGGVDLCYTDEKLRPISIL